MPYKENYFVGKYLMQNRYLVKKSFRLALGLLGIISKIYGEKQV